MTEVKALFSLPLSDNEGRDLTVEIEGLLAELFGGCLRLGRVGTIGERDSRI